MSHSNSSNPLRSKCEALWRNLASVFKGLIFPPLCLHCETWIDSRKNRLCPLCLEHLFLIPLEGRCPRCFTAIQGGRCENCIKAGSPFKRTIAAFEYEGAALSLLQHLKARKREELAKDCAAWMVVQFLRLNIPPPDLIVPVPQPFIRTLFRGYNPSLLIAQEVAKLLERPCLNLLKKRSSDFSQNSLPKERRARLPQEAIGWKKRGEIADKILLVVDDMLMTRATLRACARTLEEGYPAALYALTFCIAD